MIAAMTTMSSLYGDNTPAERRGLRSKVEKRTALLNQEYLLAADSVIQVEQHVSHKQFPRKLTDF